MKICSIISEKLKNISIQYMKETTNSQKCSAENIYNYSFIIFGTRVIYLYYWLNCLNWFTKLLKVIWGQLIGGIKFISLG